MSASGSASGSFNASGNTSTNSANLSSNSSTSPSRNTSSSTFGSSSQTGANTSTSTNTNFGTQTNSSLQTGGTVVTSDAQVTTFVQQLDTQGPAVVQRISTQVGDLACSDDTIQNLVDALHSGKSVTLTSNVNGQTQSTTFNASGAHLGYGEAYIALALAAQQLRNAGVTGCATPEQWQAVLLGGPLNVSSTTSTSASSGSTQFPGIVTLHRQGQGWGKIAQTSHVELGQIISNSSSASRTSALNSSNSSSGSSSPSPTGYSSA